MKTYFAKTSGLLLIVFFIFGGINQQGDFTINAQDNIESLDNCIMVIGDSVARGTAVFEVPGRGFPVIQTMPFSRFLDATLNEYGAYHIGVYDLSVAEASLAGALPYTTTPEYRFGLTQNCRFVVIFPWLNELSRLANPDFSASTMGLLASFVNGFRQANLNSTIILINYYSVATSSLGNMIYEGSITADSIRIANEAINSACGANGMINAIGGVSCMDIASLYSGDEHVFTSLDRNSYAELEYTVLREEDVPLIDFYWQETPDGLIFGDGVHLNHIGKTLLADALANHLLILDETVFTFDVGE